LAISSAAAGSISAITVEQPGRAAHKVKVGEGRVVEAVDHPVVNFRVAAASSSVVQ